ncbi:MAG TPA: disulfide reductase, partial [Candidatus Aminicenantes bacterium]|nr:disulfide reductase [Candidatus Aminicenantes bacterium]
MTRTGVYVCHCGGNISETVDIQQVVEDARQQSGVVLVRDHEHMCSETGQNLVVSDIKEHRLDRVVIAACSPQFQGPTFKA